MIVCDSAARQPVLATPKDSQLIIGGQIAGVFDPNGVLARGGIIRPERVFPTITFAFRAFKKALGTETLNR